MIPVKIAQANPLNPQYEYLKEAADVISRGGLVLLPTDTVYGIAADSKNQKAIERLYEIKKRPPEKRFSQLIDTKEKVEDIAVDIPVVAYKLMDAFWPGPLTLVCKAKEKDTIALRLPDNLIAQKIITLSKTSVVCPSANFSGGPAPREFGDAINNFKEAVDYAIDAGPCELGVESSIVDVTTHPLQILREGAIKKEEIMAVAHKKNVLFVCTGNSCRSVMAEAYLEKKLQENGRDDVAVISAGLMMLPGMGATEETKELLEEEGIDVSGHRSQRLTKELLDKSDIILVMENLHEERIAQLYPKALNRVYLLREFAQIKGDSLDISDPIGKSIEFYRQTFAVIKDSIERILNIL
ncbi:MAG: L-threonylcarbamoyladenylate synthase [Candidatus Omnitrophota bacterium]